MPTIAARTPDLNRVRAQRRPDRPLFQILDPRRQRARAQRHRQVLHLLIGKPAVDDARIADRFLDHRDFLHFVVENHRQIVAHVRRSKGVKLPPAVAGQNEAHRRLAVFVAARLRCAQIASRHRRRPRNQIPVFAASRCCANRYSSGHQHRIRRQHAAFILQRRLLARIWPAHRLLDLQHRRGLHDLLDPRRIVHARQLDQNLIRAQPMLLNDRLVHAQRVNAVADGLDRLRHRAVLQVGEICGFIETVQEFSAPEEAS